MACKSICVRLKGARKRGGKYTKGYKMCMTCDLGFIYEGLWCPCCGNRIRSNPRYKGNARKMEVKRI